MASRLQGGISHEPIFHGPIRDFDYIFSLKRCVWLDVFKPSISFLILIIYILYIDTDGHLLSRLAQHLL